MSLVFKRVNEIKYEEQPTFAESSALYEALLGDNNFPTSCEGALPVVVEVPLGLVASILYTAGVITFQRFIFDSSENITFPERKEPCAEVVAQLEGWEAEIGADIMQDAIKELLDKEDRGTTLKLLLSDYQHAVKMNWGGILYQV